MPEQNEAKDDEQQAARNRAGTSPNDSSTVSKQNQSAEHQDQGRPRKWLSRKRVFAVIELCLAAIGVLILFLQSGLMKKQNDLMGKQLMNERAWVVPYEIGSEPKGPQTIFKVLFRNTGNTPAVRVSAWINRTASLTQLQSATEHRGPEAGMILAPNGIGNTSTADLPIEPADVEAIKRGLRVYIYGTIWYDDIFTETHWTSFCYFTGSDLKAFGPCPIHNTCDDCEQGKAQK